MSKRKISAILIAVFVTVAVSASVLSYSIANKERKGLEDNIVAKNELTAYGANNLENMTYISNIDMIIEDSNKDADYTYNIVELIPATEAGYTSGLQAYIASEGFKKYVIDANKSSAKDDMKSGTIKYTPIVLSSDTVLTTEVSAGVTVQEVLGSADLVYLASPSFTSYTASDNISEDIYNWLHTYTLEKDNEHPLILDYVTNTTSSGNTNKNFHDYANAVSKNYIKYRTYGWDSAKVNAEDFFQSKGSYYITFNTNKKTATGKVLVISSDASGGSLRAALSEKVIAQNAYYGNSKPSEDDITFTIKTPAEIAADLTQVEAGQYDFVFIEGNVGNVTMSPEMYNALIKLSEAGSYVVYDAGLETIGDGSGSSGGTSNYHRLMDLLLNKGHSRYDNVLPVANTFFTSLNEAGKDGADGAKSVADLIDSGVYRGNKGGAGNKKFRVLEIEPCYPIDEELAKSQGKYYTDPDGVMYGATKDEIAIGQEYYAFEISRAKIAHATGLDYKQIQIDQMSTNEFISSKEVVVESYDLVYIGGDISALRTRAESFYSGRDWYIKGLMTYFQMYTHTGVWQPISSENAGYIAADTFAESNGNDITVLKLEQLRDYVDAGMPLIVDKVVADAFTESYNSGSRLAQLSLDNIDPDSNMYKFLDYVYEKTQNGTTPSIYFGTFGTKEAGSTTQADNSEGTLGNTLGSYATVYNDKIGEAIKNLINQSATRPTLTISSKPVDYVEGDSSTINTDTTMTVTANIKSMSSDVTDYTLALYVDKNGDNTFSEDELVGGEDGGLGKVAYKTGEDGTGRVDLTYSLPEDYFGLVSWKVVANVTGKTICDMAEGYAYFKPDPDMKKTVKVLQIAPRNGRQDKNKLFFCTECEQAQKMVTGNIYISSQANFQQWSAGYQGVTDDSNGTEPFTGVYAGLHEHNFGITKYDTVKGDDDWETNYADILTHGADGTLDTGDFEFELEIIFPEEFNSFCDTVSGLSDDQVAAYQSEKQQQLLDIKSLKQDSTYVSYKLALQTEMLNFVENYADMAIKKQKPREIIKAGVGTSANPGQWILDERYYKFWEYFTSNNDTVAISPKSDASATAAERSLANLITAWENYVTEHDKIIKKKQTYADYCHKAGTEKTWIKNSYDIVVLGFADDFGSKDLTELAASQLKAYVDAGGSVLNTHDTMTKYKSQASVNLTNALREAFGMDRFHVKDGRNSDDVTLAYDVPEVVSNTITFYPQAGNQWYTPNALCEVSYKNTDMQVSYEVANAWDDPFSGNVSITETGVTHSSTDDNVTITVNLGTISTQSKNKSFYYTTADNPNQYIQVTTDSSGIVKISVPQRIGYTRYTAEFAASANKVTGTWDILAGTVTAQSGAETTNSKCEAELNVVYNGSALANGEQVTISFRNVESTATVSNGKVTFDVDLNQQGLSSIYDVPASGSKYRKFATKDASKYFFTERAIIDDGNYASWETKSGVYSGYNTPIGFTDSYIAQNRSAGNEIRAFIPYKYASLDPQIFNNVDGDYPSYDAKYGTRRASQINKGSVTVYPFTIGSELKIAATHAQAYALDLEDPSLCVWYAIGGNMTDKGSAWEFTSIYSASPRDGMNNYFLYSKGNIFYCGAGHAGVTGYSRDNNDERRLFINVIVNSATRAKSVPKIKLYNACDKDTEDCEHLLVSKTDEEANKKLSKQKNTLYYNEALKMYQYNIDETEEYPEFDFKITQGSAALENTYVFYDLDYGTGTGQDLSGMYTKDKNHVLIQSYDRNDDLSGTRVRLRKDDPSMKNLKLEESYFGSSNVTYIVICTTDANGEVTTARVMINRIPYLFDLTDATITNKHQSFTTIQSMMDITDRNKFNI